MVSALFHLNNNEAIHELKSTPTMKAWLFLWTQIPQKKHCTGHSCIAYTSSHFTKSWHHMSHSWGSLL